MSVLSLVILLIVIGVALYLVNSAIPMDPKIKAILNVVVVVVVLLWVLDAFGIIGSLGTVRIVR